MLNLTLSTEEIRERSKLTKEEWREYTKTVWHIANVTHAEHPAVFPPEIPKRLIKMFTFYGESVLDPFAGTGTTAQTALALGRSAICVEQNPSYIPLIEAQANSVDPESGAELRVVHGDSRNMQFIDNDTVAAIVTSPPYWNKANYGDGSENLGNFPRYHQFLREIRPVFEESFRVLMPGRKLCVVTANVNQYTNHGLLTFPLAADFATMLREIGLVMVTEIIWSKDGTGGKWGSFGEQRPIFGSYPYPPNFLFKNIHEHILVFAKPPRKKTTSAKALPYEWLMSSEDGGSEDLHLGD